MILIDTHILIWAMASPENLTPAERNVLEDITRPIFVSAASIWECAIKCGLGKLKLPPDFESRVQQTTGYKIVPIDAVMAWRVKDLPQHHGDPFDRLIIATAQEKHFTLMTRDRIFAQYDVLLWE
ncbi:MAG: type II toxin-antitoxin system VapC family toxin [Gammaproteobacteria bacterium]|nr:type II toxin-antitoxin system VapC family toxin [Gammaproteobacteria bacterium]